MPDPYGRPRREADESGVLTAAAAPIGRAKTRSARLATELAEATLIAAEDTRRVRWLAASLNVELKARVVSTTTRSRPGVRRACSRTSRRARTSCSSPTRAPRPSATRATGWWLPRPRPACG